MSLLRRSSLLGVLAAGLASWMPAFAGMTNPGAFAFAFAFASAPAPAPAPAPALAEIRAARHATTIPGTNLAAKNPDTRHSAKNPGTRHSAKITGAQLSAKNRAAHNASASSPRRRGSSLPVQRCGLATGQATSINVSGVTPAFVPPPGTQPDEATWRRRTQAANTALNQHPWLRDYLPATDRGANQSAPAPPPVMPCDHTPSLRHSREGGNPASRSTECNPVAVDPRTGEGEATEPRGAPTIPLNPLIHASSPYLLQHAFNPIDWREYPGPERSDTRLRLISIGYSTCYWCHRMAEEAFSDPRIGELLNTRFHAIKIDREQRPEIDAHYTRLQRLSGGEVGWPVTVIESASGDVLFVGSYLEADALHGLLQRLDRLLGAAPAALDAMAASFRALQAQQAASAGSGSAAVEAIELLPTSDFLRDDWDAELGGRVGNQKFPDPPLLDWLLDRALREPDSGAAAALATQLDRMLASGLFDPLHGGFFRYSTQRDWSQPHYEKMLHTQAQLLRIYARAGAHWQRPAWQSAAKRIAGFSKAWLAGTDGLYASAVDARFQGREGGYYLLPPATSARLRRERSWLAEDASAELRQLRLAPAALDLSDLDAALESLAATISSPAARPFIDSKTLTDWNALQAEALLALSDLPGSSAAADHAIAIIDRLWQRFDPASGALQRDQHGSVSAALSDYAHLAKALQAQHARSLSAQALQRSAQLLRAAVSRYLPNDSAAELAQGEPGRDSETPAPLASLCEALYRQSTRDPDEAWRSDSQRCLSTLTTLASSHDGHNWSAQRTQALVEHGEIAPAVLFADGKGRAWLRHDAGTKRSQVQLDLQPGWHVNAHDARIERLVPTALMPVDNAGQALAVHYPAGSEQTLSVFDAPLRLYEGRVLLTIDGDAERASLRVQACSERICLLPETLTLVR